MKQCKKCGTILNDTGKFCPNCGEKIEEQTEKSPKKIKPNWKKRGIFITVISVLTVAVAGGVAWTIRNHKTENRKADDVGKEKVVGKEKKEDEIYAFPNQGKWGFINEDKEWVINPQYEYANDFVTYGSEQFAVIAEGNGYGSWNYGLINKNSQEILPMKYSKIGIYENENGDLLFGKEIYEGEDYYKDITEIVEGGNGISSTEAEKRYRIEITDANDNRITEKIFNNVVSTNKKNILKYTSQDGTYGLLSTDGEILTLQEYNEIGDFGENGFAVVQEETEDSLYGYINEKGEEVIPCIYESAGDFANNGLACIGMKIGEDVKYGYINEKGEEIIPCQYDAAGDFTNNGLAFVAKEDTSGNTQYGYINAKGEEIIALQYDYADNFSDNGLALVENDEKYGYIDEKGNVALDFQYDYAENFENKNYAYVGEKDKRGFIDYQGKWNETPIYHQLYSYEEIRGYNQNIRDTWIGIYEDFEKYDLIQNGEVIATGIDIPVISGNKVIVATKKEDGKIYFGIQNLDGTWFIKPNENSWMKDVLQEERDTWYTPAE